MEIIKLKDCLPDRLVEKKCGHGETNAKTGCTPEGGEGSSKSDSGGDNAKGESMSAKEKSAYKSYTGNRKKTIDLEVKGYAEVNGVTDQKELDEFRQKTSMKIDAKALMDGLDAESSAETKAAILKSYNRKLTNTELKTVYHMMNGIADRADRSVWSDKIYEKNKEQLDKNFEQYSKSISDETIRPPRLPVKLILYSTKTSEKMKKTAVMDSWVKSPSGSASTYVQQYLVDKFKMGDGDKKGLARRTERISPMDFKEDIPREQMNATIDTIYNETQENFKKNGVKNLTIYRGVADGDIDHDNPLESWTVSKEVAKEYDDKVLKQKVPVSRIFMSADNTSDFPDPVAHADAPPSQEVVLLGGTREDGNDLPPAKGVK